MNHSKNHALKIEKYFNAVKHGNLFLVNSYISQGFDPNYQNSNGWSTLMAASVAGQDAVLHCLLKAGADVNLCRAEDMSSPLLTAIELSKTTEDQCLKCVNILISAGAKVNAVDIIGKTPIMAAAEMDFGKVVLALLAVGANINLKDNKKKSAIDFAIEKGSKNGLKSLLEGPAVPRLGKDVCHFAVNLALALKNRYFAALIQKHITSSITEKDWSNIPEDEIDVVLTNRTEVDIVDCKNVAESHLFSWGLPHLIPLFRQHKITDDVLSHMTDADFENIGVKAVHRCKIVQESETLFCKNKQKIARGTAMPGLTFSEALAAIENMKDHLVYIYAIFGHRLKDKIIDNPKQLAYRLDHYTVSDLVKYCADCSHSLAQLKENVIALNNIVVDIDECEDESRRLQDSVYNYYKRITITLSAVTAVVAVSLYIFKQ